MHLIQELAYGPEVLTLEYQLASLRNIVGFCFVVELCKNIVEIYAWFAFHFLCLFDRGDVFKVKCFFVLFLKPELQRTGRRHKRVQEYISIFGVGIQRLLSKVGRSRSPDCKYQRFRLCEVPSLLSDVLLELGDQPVAPKAQIK